MKSPAPPSFAAPASGFMTEQTVTVDGGVMVKTPGGESGRLMSAGAPILVPVLSNHRFDEVALARYLAASCPVSAGR